jgi:hypothetical protein
MTNLASRGLLSAQPDQEETHKSFAIDEALSSHQTLISAGSARRIYA